MGTIKIELDIPNFEKELKINIIICKDGEVSYSTSSPTNNNLGIKSEEKPLNESLNEEKSEKPKKKSIGKIGGNLMAADF